MLVCVGWVHWEAGGFDGGKVALGMLVRDLGSGVMHGFVSVTGFLC